MKGLSTVIKSRNNSHNVFFFILDKQKPYLGTLPQAFFKMNYYDYDSSVRKCIRVEFYIIYWRKNKFHFESKFWHLTREKSMPS